MPLFSQINDILSRSALVLASLITSSGSSPRTSGARMLILPDGAIKGTVGGGRYEAEAIKEAMRLMQNSGNASLMRFDLNQAGDMDMICGGDILVLLEHIVPSDENLAFFASASEAENRDKTFAIGSFLQFEALDLASLPPNGSPRNGQVARRLFLREACSSLPPELTAVLNDAWQSVAPFIRKVNGQNWLFEPFLPPERIHIIGGGHVSLALANLAETTGFYTSVLDDRPEFTSPERFPHSRLPHITSLAEIELDKYFGGANLDRRDGVVIVTRGHAFDREALAAALRTPAGYIGMIGSSTKRRQVYSSLLQSGFTETDLARVHSPIGVSIGAETPEEIAVSIMGELIMWRRGKLAQSGER